MKKIAALALSLLLLFSLSLTAFASQELSDLADDLLSSTEADAAEPAPDMIAADDNENGRNAEGHNGREEYRARSTEVVEDASELPTELSTEKPTAAEKTENTEPAAEAAVTDRDDGNQLVRIIVIVSGVLLLLLIIVLAVLLLRRNSSTVAGGSTVRVEVLSGLCYNVNFEFNFRRGLTIGTAKTCDLVFEDPRMLPLHAVISRASGGRMTLSECDNTGNTYIGGMKIFAPNRLRSGDIITIGMTSFRVYFDA